MSLLLFKDLLLDIILPYLYGTRELYAFLSDQGWQKYYPRILNSVYDLILTKEEYRDICGLESIIIITYHRECREKKVDIPDTFSCEDLFRLACDESYPPMVKFFKNYFDRKGQNVDKQFTKFIGSAICYDAWDRVWDPENEIMTYLMNKSIDGF